MRATGSHEVIFRHVRVAAEHAVDVWPVDAPPAARAEPLRLFANRQTALLAAIYDGIARAAHHWLVRWLTGRVPAGLGHPLSRLPRVQEKVGQIAGLLLVNRSLLEQAAALRFSAIEANLAKVTITDNAIQAVNIALELTGNHGLSRQNPLERHYRNVLCGRVHTPQSDSPAGSRPLRLSITRIITMRLSFSGRVAAALMLLALGGYATAQERLTLRIADQKGGMRSQLEAANALQNSSPTTLSGPNSRPPRRWRKPLTRARWTRGSSAMRRCSSPLANGAPVKAIAVDKSNPAGTAVLVSPAAR